jgi:chromosome segregation protein
VLEGEKRDRADGLRSVLSERTSWEQSLEGMKDGLARSRSRRDSLRELQDSRAGYTEGVRAVLAASSRDDALALVAEILEIPAEHERAVAAVLGEELQALIMRDQDTAKDAVQALRRAGAGRAMCLPLDVVGGRPTSTPPAPARPLLDLVRVREGYERVASVLLGSVYMVEDLDAAIALWRGGEAPWTLVTPAGETLAPSGAVTGGSERSEETCSRSGVSSVASMERWSSGKASWQRHAHDPTSSRCSSTSASGRSKRSIPSSRKSP